MKSSTINHSGNSGGGISINSDIGDLVFGNIFYTSEDNVNGILYSGGDGFNISGNYFYTYGANSHGIYVFEVTNSFVEDNFVSSYGNESCAIYLEYNSVGNEVKANNLSAGGINGCGIYLESDSPNNLLMDNFILAFGQDAFAIDIASNTNNLTGNNIITTNNRGAGIFLENEGLDNVIYGGSILTSGEENHGVYVGNNVGTLTITGINLKTLNLNSYALYVLGGDMNLSVSHSILNSSFYNTPDFKIGDLIIGGVWNFTNVSFLDKNWPEDIEAVLYVTDYLDILTSYANGSEAANVNVTAFDSNGSFQFSELSNEDGEIPSKLLFEYVQSGYDQIFSYSNYTLTASLYDWSENLSKSINLSEIEIVRFIFGEEPESVLESPPDLEEEADPEQVGGGSCKSGWKCSKWSECVNGKKTRTCVNKNPLCNAGKPPEEKECEEKRKALFDINLRLLNEKVTPGQRLLGAITLINVGLPGKVDANLHYSIEDDLGDNLGEWHENVQVETQTEFIKSFNTRGLEEGGYTLFVNLDYEGQLEPASTESRFVVANVGQTPDNIWKLSVWLIFVLFVLAISFLVFLKRRNLKRVVDEKGVLEESVTEEPVAMKP